jgi:hypothetical protein
MAPALTPQTSPACKPIKAPRHARLRTALPATSSLRWKSSRLAGRASFLEVLRLDHPQVAAAQAQQRLLEQPVEVGVDDSRNLPAGDLPVSTPASQATTLKRFPSSVSWTLVR